jgi:hypothetical protein
VIGRVVACSSSRKVSGLTPTVVRPVLSLWLMILCSSDGLAFVAYMVASIAWTMWCSYGGDMCLSMLASMLHLCLLQWHIDGPQCGVSRSL